MRMSCNGCRVLRKGCSDDCAIRPCLQWINSPESQANATLFLAKFYGRAGLMNLINAGPEHHRPVIFRSLLYEACGRMVNPIYGSVGLLWSGNFQLCQSAVESVLNGSPVMPITSEAAAESQGPPLKLCDIRHVSKDENSVENRGKSRSRVKRSGAAAKAKAKEAAKGQHPSESNVSDLSVSQEQVHESKESASIVSVETTEEACFRFRAEQDTTTVEAGAADDNNRSCCEGEMKLDLTLGIVHTRDQHLVPVKKRKYEAFVLSSAADENREGKIVPGMDCSSGDSVGT